MSLIVGERHNDVCVGDLDAGGRRIANVRRVTFAGRLNSPEAWTPDGAALILDTFEGGLSHVARQTLL